MLLYLEILRIMTVLVNLSVFCFFCFVNEKLKSINIELGKHSAFDIFLIVDFFFKKKVIYNDPFLHVFYF
jgi:hypothetical protein